MTESSPASPDVPGNENSAVRSAPAQPPRPGLAELFVAFVTISLSGFGGVLAWSRRTMVEHRRWLTAEQFNEIYAFSSFLPGPNIVNLSVVFGSRLRGASGALVALTGLLGPPLILVTIVAALYAHYGDVPALRRALTGVAAAAAGLMMATVAKMAQPLFRDRTLAGLTAPLIGFVTFVSIGIIHWPLPLVLTIIVPVSFVLSWVRR
jgi:chromate transporter